MSKANFPTPTKDAVVWTREEIEAYLRGKGKDVPQSADALEASMRSQ